MNVTLCKTAIFERVVRVHMDIRPATADDLDGINRVARASWEADYPEILSRETVSAGVDEWYGAAAFADELEWAHTLAFVATADDEPVGFVHAMWAGEEGHVLRLYVHPDHRREGVGTALLERVRSELYDRDIERIDAMVLADNELGKAFYERFGFEAADESETTIGGEQYRETRYTLTDSGDS